MSVVRAVLTLLMGLLLAVAGLALVPAPAWASGTVTVTVAGHGTVTAEGISCGPNSSGDCTQFYADDVTQECDPERKPPCIDVRTPPTVQLTASPGSNGHSFVGWSGCDATNGSACTVTVESSRGVTAQYQDIQAPNVSAPHAPGTVRGTINLGSSASDNSGQIHRVEFRVRGVLVATDTSAPYTAQFDTSTVADGTASVVATAYDFAGHSSSAGNLVTIDNTAPETTVTSGPPDGALTTSRSATFEFSAEDTATFGCRLYRDGETAPDFGACSGATSHSVVDLADGGWVFQVRATDAVGNVETSPEERTFTVDTVAPDTTITKAPKAVVKTNKRRVRAEFEFVATEPVQGFQCKLDDGRWKECSSPAGYRVTKGKHTLKVRATDLAGHRDSTPATWTWRVRRR